MAGLGIASAITSALTVALAIWSRFWRCSAHVDGLRCRTVLAMGISTACYSVSQLSLLSQSKQEAASVGVRIFVFMANFSLIANALIVACCIGMDAAVRYGLRSFGLARRLGRFYEMACITIALAVSQPIFYLFSSVLWTGSGVVVEAKSRAFFNAAEWMIESIWTLLAMVLAILFIGYALVKARKIGRYTGRFTNASMESVLGTTASIRGRVYVSLCYVAAFVGLSIWRVLFRMTGSQSMWLLRMASVCNSLHAELTLLVFVIDLLVNVNKRPVWLGPSPSCSVETISHKTGHVLAEYQMSSSDFSSIGDSSSTVKSAWHTMAGAASKARCQPTAKEVGGWLEEINRCHIRSNVGRCENDGGFSTSDMSSEGGLAEYHSGSMVLHPLAW
ncbi:hypothetical protein LPJ75_003087 [Coemansia sp. RSA 2598]|nr:hypothetical protein LPJ75_003087 [Coemansia sp. RSA 2598]